jgi:RNA polymerase sigma-70 factor (ECF subfamily)
MAIHHGLLRREFGLQNGIYTIAPVSKKGESYPRRPTLQVSEYKETAAHRYWDNRWGALVEARPDVELVKEVQNGSREAFAELMKRYQERVYWVARRVVGSHDDADDVVQETFVKAYLALGDFRGDASFYTWIYRIAVNMSLNVLRKRKILSYLHESELLTRILSSSDDPEKDLEQSEIETALKRVIAKLPGKQKAVFVMRYFDEMTYKEIGIVLKTSEGGLKANYFHALRKVRKHMRHEIRESSHLKYVRSSGRR